MIIEYIKSLYNKGKNKEIKPTYIEGSMKNIMNLLNKMQLDFRKCHISLEKDVIELKYNDNIDYINDTSTVEVIDINITFEVSYIDKMYNIYLRYNKVPIVGASLYNIYTSNSNYKDDNNNFEVVCLDNSVDVKWKDIFTFFENLNDLKQQYLYETFLINVKTDYKLLRDEKLEILMKSIENEDENTTN